MTFSFDEPIERRGTTSLKWGRYGARDVIPLWVADMDFRAPPVVLEAMQECLAHGVFGYSRPPRSLTEATLHHLARDFDWTVQASWIVWLPGLVSGLNIAARAVGNPGDTDLVFTPVYPPFLRVPELSNRVLAKVPLIQEPRDQRWTIDFDALERATPAKGAHLLLCNPHNPVGRVFTRPELNRLVEFCLRRNVTLTSDEIHNGLVLDADRRHLCVAALSEEIAQRSITLMAPSKTFNIPDLGSAFAVIPNPTLRTQFTAVMEGIVPHGNALGYAATEAAYRAGEPWRLELIDYLRGNWKRVAETIAAIPGLSLTPLEGTYLAWIDARHLGVPDPCRFFEQAGVGLSDGTDFGLPGFVRLNFGCPRKLLDEALERMTRAVAEVRASRPIADPNPAP